VASGVAVVVGATRALEASACTLTAVKLVSGLTSELVLIRVWVGLSGVTEVVDCVTARLASPMDGSSASRTP